MIAEQTLIFTWALLIMALLLLTTFVITGITNVIALWFMPAWHSICEQWWKIREIGTLE